MYFIRYRINMIKFGFNKDKSLKPKYILQIECIFIYTLTYLKSILNILCFFLDSKWNKKAIDFIMTYNFWFIFL